MKQINIDIENGAPPSSQELNTLREKTSKELNRLVKRKPWLPRGCIAVAALVIIEIFSLWWFGVFPAPSTVAISLIVCMVAIIGFVAGSGSDEDGFLGGLMFVFVIYLIWLSSFEGVNSGEEKVVFLVGISTIMAVYIIAFAIPFYYRTKVEIPIADKANLLETLRPLNANDSPRQCIEYDRLVREDEAVAAYHEKLALMGRKPVLAECNAALEWEAGAEKRQNKKEQKKEAAAFRKAALEACARIG
jgi:hypothetical protein